MIAAIIIWAIALVLFIVLVSNKDRLTYPYDPYKTCCHGINPDFVAANDGQFEEDCCNFVADEGRCIECIRSNKVLKAKTSFFGGGNPKNLFYILSFTLLLILVLFIPLYLVKDKIEYKWN